jgi:hypothetical protein
VFAAVNSIFVSSEELQIMVPGIPTLGIRFDIEKVAGGSYGFEAWKIFWGAIDPEAIRSSILFEGDTDATLRGRESVFCIAIQCAESKEIERVKAVFSQDEKFGQVAAWPRFAEGNACAFEPLPDAGRIDAMGNLVGDAYESLAALDSVRKERAAAAPKSSMVDQGLNRRRS